MHVLRDSSPKNIFFCHYSLTHGIPNAYNVKFVYGIIWMSVASNLICSQVPRKQMSWHLSGLFLLNTQTMEIFIYYLEKWPILIIKSKTTPKFCHIIVLFFDRENTPNRYLVEITKVNSKSLEFVHVEISSDESLKWHSHTCRCKNSLSGCRMA